MRLILDRVPPGLRSLHPPAERFGILDGGYREQLVLATPRHELAQLKEEVTAHDDLRDQWLDGPETDGPTFLRVSQARPKAREASISTSMVPSRTGGSVRPDTKTAFSRLSTRQTPMSTSQPLSKTKSRGWF